MSAYTKQSINNKYLNRNVQIKTAHGTYKGKIIKVDNKKVYLKVSSSSHIKDGKARISFFPFFPFIIPLVLFELLIIVLLDTKRPFTECKK